MVKYVPLHPEADPNVDEHTNKNLFFLKFPKKFTVIEEAKFSRNLGAITANSCCEVI